VQKVNKFLYSCFHFTTKSLKFNYGFETAKKFSANFYPQYSFLAFLALCHLQNPPAVFAIDNSLFNPCWDIDFFSYFISISYSHSRFLIFQHPPRFFRQFFYCRLFTTSPNKTGPPFKSNSFDRDFNLFRNLLLFQKAD